MFSSDVDSTVAVHMHICLHRLYNGQPLYVWVNVGSECTWMLVHICLFLLFMSK